MSSCQLNAKDIDYTVKIALDENLNFGLEFACLKSNDIYIYSESSENIAKFTNQCDAGMDINRFYKCVKTAVEDNLIVLSKPTSNTLCVTFHHIVKLTPEQFTMKKIPVTLWKVNHTNIQALLNFSLSLVETIDDLLNLVSVDSSGLPKLSDIRDRLEKLQIPSGSLTEKISNIQTKLKKLTVPTNSLIEPRLINRNVKGPPDSRARDSVKSSTENLVSLDDIEFENQCGINGHVIDSIVNCRRFHKVNHVMLRPTVKNLTPNVINVTTQHHLLSYCDSIPEQKKYYGKKSTILTQAYQIMPHGTLTLNSHFMLTQEDRKILSHGCWSTIVCTIDGDINAIEWVNVNPDSSYCCDTYHVLENNSL